MSGRPPAAAQKKIERKNGAPVPCREWCYQGVLGQPTPANPPKYPESGCMGHRAHAPCMITRDNKPKWFAHPDEPEWQQVPGIAQAKASVAAAEPEWRRGNFAVVKEPRSHRGKLMVPAVAAPPKPRSPLGLGLKEGELSWGDHIYYEEHPEQAHHAEGRVLPAFEALMPKAKSPSKKARRNNATRKRR